MHKDHSVSEIDQKDFQKNGVPPIHCPVCLSTKIKPFMKVKDLYYWTCKACGARLLSSKHWLSHKKELAYYQTHENDSNEEGYRKYVSKLAVPLLDKLSTPSKGLDFGSGPDPALAAILKENGHKMTLYDPFFYDCTGSLTHTYDFITCSEVVEHFRQPAKQFDLLNRLVRPGGWIGVLTKFQTVDSLFKNWRYRRDPTHIVFYRKITLEVIAKQRQWAIEFPCQDVVLFKKQ